MIDALSWTADGFPPNRYAAAYVDGDGRWKKENFQRSAAISPSATGKSHL